MQKVSGLIVPKLCHTRHDGNIRCLEPVAPSAHHHDYGSGEYEEAPFNRNRRRLGYTDAVLRYIERPRNAEGQGVDF